MTALIILSLFSSAVVVVVNRSIESVGDSRLRMEAFEVSRENMENLLSLETAKEMVEYGESEKNPEIQWRKMVEVFEEPVNSQSWLRGICSAEYVDSSGELQTVELVHWITNLTEEELKKIKESREEEGLLDAMLTIEEAAEYAGVDKEVIEEWIENGMPTKDGSFVPLWLDLYKESDGRPSERRKEEFVEEYPILEEQEIEAVDDNEEQLDDQYDEMLNEMFENADPQFREMLEEMLRQGR